MVYEMASWRAQCKRDGGRSQSKGPQEEERTSESCINIDTK